MRTTRYVLSPKSFGWRRRDHPDEGDRFFEVSLAVERDAGVPLGGHNIQVVLGAPDQARHGLNEDVVLWLDSGWWVTLRNQFADAPDVAISILRPAADELSRLTELVSSGECGQHQALLERVHAISIETAGPDYWR
jgi:hypothetical protein